MGKNLFPFPVGGQNDFFPVRTYMIVFNGNKGGIVLELASPCISYVYIDRVSVSV